MAKRKWTEVKLTLKANHLNGDNKSGRLTVVALVRNDQYERLKKTHYVEIVKLVPTHTEVIQ